MAEKVVSGDDEETPIIDKPEGEGKKAKGGGDKARKEKTAEQARREEKRGEEEKKWHKEIEDHTPEDQKIQFEKAETTVKVVRAVQDVSEEGMVQIDSKELENLKKFLQTYTELKPETIDKMSKGEIVAAAQIVLKKSQIILSEKGLEGQLQNADISEVQTGEILGLEKVARQLEVVDEYEKMIDRSGPGTTEGTPPEEDWTEALPDESTVPSELRPYVQQIKKLKDKSPSIQKRSLQVIEESLSTAILKGEIADDENTSVIKEVIDNRVEVLAEKAAEAQFEREQQRRGLISEEGEAGIRRYVSEHEAEIAAKFRELDPKERNEKVGDIEREASTYYTQIISGFGATPEQAKSGLLELARRSDDSEGYKRWRAVKLADKFDDAVRISQLFQPPVDWEETPQKISEILGIMEASDLSVEDLGTTIQGAIGMIQKVEWGTKEGRQMRDSLIGELEAFRGVHSLRITLEQNDMDPTNFIDLYRKYFDDKTLANFVRRFGKDRLGRQFQNEKGEAVNLLDLSFELYMQQLHDERVRMNIVEEMTRHSITNKFSGSEMRSFEEWLGIPLTDELKGQIEELRQYFVKKMQAEIEKTEGIKNLSVDDVWGRKGTREINGKEIHFLQVTHDVIQKWHDKKTLQGAFGVVEEDDLADLKEEFGGKFSENWKGKEFLTIRRNILLDQLQEELSQMGLKVLNEKGEEQKINIETLREYGTLDSVGLNAYHLAWMMGWSTYDSVRIYSRDSTSQLRDDYDHLVFHDSTNLFFGRQLDQTWEHYSEMNENRGHPKENDVNRIWKQYLPGKHSWLFPQNNMMTRWSEFFLSDAQKNEVAKRTREYMQQWDFDNEKYHGEFAGWMKNAVVRDMIESGEISFGKEAVEAGGTRLSKIAEEMKLRKFEFIDLWVDRTSHKKFTDPEALQEYLGHPSEAKFMEINDKVKAFYSTRDARLFPWMTLATRAHWEIANHHRRRIYNDPDLKASQGERFIDDLISSDYMERKQGEKEKKELFGLKEITIGGSWGTPRLAKFPLPDWLGTTPFRRIRQSFELVRRDLWDAKWLPAGMTVAGIWAAIIEFFRQLGKETQRQH